MIKTKNEKPTTPDGKSGGGMSLAQDVREKVKRLVADQFDGNESAAAREWGVKQNTLNRLGRGINTGYKDVCEILDKIGVKLVWPGEVNVTDRSLTFASPELLNIEGNTPPPVGDEYRAIPLTSAEVAAGPGLIPEDGIQGWCILWKNIPALLRRRNLLCSRLADKQNSMEPTLHPGDFIVIDRNDIIIPSINKGNIFLIRDKYDGIAVKRLSLQQQGMESLLIVHSDNKFFPPYSINVTQEFEDQLSNVVIGKVVYSWSDMSKQ